VTRCNDFILINFKSNLTPYLQRLANILGVEVMAPDGFYYYNKDGSGRAGTYINGTWPANGVRGVDPQIGSMRPFLPTRQ
jgi:hypothetical protein